MFVNHILDNHYFKPGINVHPYKSGLCNIQSDIRSVAFLTFPHHVSVSTYISSICNGLIYLFYKNYKSANHHK